MAKNRLLLLEDKRAKAIPQLLNILDPFNLFYYELNYTYCLHIRRLINFGQFPFNKKEHPS
jgi:hypothetical protein